MHLPSLKVIGGLTPWVSSLASRHRPRTAPREAGDCSTGTLKGCRGSHRARQRWELPRSVADQRQLCHRGQTVRDGHASRAEITASLGAGKATIKPELARARLLATLHSFFSGCFEEKRPCLASRPKALPKLPGGARRHPRTCAAVPAAAATGGVHTLQLRRRTPRHGTSLFIPALSLWPLVGCLMPLTEFPSLFRGQQQSPVSHARTRCYRGIAEHAPHSMPNAVVH